MGRPSLTAHFLVGIEAPTRIFQSLDARQAHKSPLANILRRPERQSKSQARGLVGLGHSNLKEFCPAADGAGGRKKIYSRVLDRGEGIVYI